MKSKKGAGIIPIAIKKGVAWIMLGRESRDIEFSDSGKWSDFGGGCEKGESFIQCAAREGYEETMGMFGGPVEITDLINDKLVCKIKGRNYISYAVHVKYNKELPKKFTKIYECVKSGEPNLIVKNNGFFEKDRVRWFKLKKVDDYDIILRDHFKPILSDLCDQLLG